MLGVYVEEGLAISPTFSDEVGSRWFVSWEGILKMIAEILVSIWSSLRECVQQDTMRSIVSERYYCSWLSESFSKTFIETQLG